MDYILFEDERHQDLKPFTLTRPSFALRCGIWTFQEKWGKALSHPLFTLTRPNLQEIFQRLPPEDNDRVWINGRFGPDEELLRAIKDIGPQSFFCNKAGEVLLIRTSPNNKLDLLPSQINPEHLEELGFQKIIYGKDLLGIRRPSDIFRLNKAFILRDFEWLVRESGPSAPLRDPHSRVYGKDNLYLAPGAEIRASIINAEDGPVYVGREARVLEGSIILNTHAIGDHCTVSAGAKLRGDSSFGPWVKVGGEVGNSVIMGYANKGHDGYLGNSVLGYWCNIGADSNTSNLKNNYSHIKVWNYTSESLQDTGLQFHGLLMGDHSKCGINTMFNTGTTVGVSANIYGGDFPPKFIPSFTWGNTTYNFEKAMNTAERVMMRRKLALSQADRRLLQKVYEESSKFRTWEKQKQN